MPTHVHLVLITFPDLPLGRVMRLLKGGVSHAVLAAAPELRADLGDHLWQEGYDWVEITSHEQCRNAVRYVRENRQCGGLVEASSHDSQLPGHAARPVNSRSAAPARGSELPAHAPGD